MHPSLEDGTLTPAQRSMGGSTFRVVAAGAILALAVGFGFAWGSSSGGTRRASSLSMDAYYDRLFAQDAAKAQGRQQKLWQGALSASLARKIVMKDTERGATAKARAPTTAATASSVISGDKAAPAKPAPVHAAPVRDAPVRTAPVQAAATKHAQVEAAGKAALATVATAAPATAAKVALAKAAEKAPAVAAKAEPATAAKAVLATVVPGKAVQKHAHGTGKLFDAFAAAASGKKMIGLNAKLPAGRELPVSDSEKLALKPAAVHGAKLRALNHLSAKAADGSAHAAAGGAPKAKAKPPKKGSQEWERQSDANFFDSLDKNESSEERAARKIKDRVQRRAKVHELYEREEEERVHRMNVKAREEQRNAELAAQKYTQSAFKDMDKHLTHINQDSVTGFKAMEAKELASEVERDHPNESAGQIAARAMKLLGMVLKGQQSTPHVGAVQNIVSPLGPMGVAPQVGM